MFPDHLTLWELRKGDDEFQVLIPASTSQRDYRLRLDEALRTLEIAVGLSRQQLLRSILAGPNDLLRIQARVPDLTPGLIPIDAGAHLAEEARNLVAAAACAALRPQMSYPSRKPAGVPEYLGRVRLGQTEVGSYILTVYSPLEEPTLAPVDDRLFDVESAPFGRRVTRKLTMALEATRTAVGQVRSGSNYDVFMDAVLQGVSSNLVQAVATMVQPGSGVESVDINITWGRAVPGPETDWTARFTPDDAPVLEDAAALLRGESPQTGYMAFGHVVGLHRAEGAVAGHVRIITDVDGKMRIVETSLTGEDYDVAIEAHKAKALVVCTGDLVKRGRTLWLDEPKDFAISSE
ncbi:MAG: hypothetical protein AB7V19_07460 [Candidatus Bipolaricaulia bacterium]